MPEASLATVLDYGAFKIVAEQILSAPNVDVVQQTATGARPDERSVDENSGSFEFPRCEKTDHRREELEENSRRIAEKILQRGVSILVARPHREAENAALLAGTQVAHVKLSARQTRFIQVLPGEVMLKASASTFRVVGFGNAFAHNLARVVCR